MRMWAGKPYKQRIIRKLIQLAIKKEWEFFSQCEHS